MPRIPWHASLLFRREVEATVKRAPEQRAFSEFMVDAGSVLANTNIELAPAANGNDAPITGERREGPHAFCRAAKTARSVGSCEPPR